MDMSKKISFGFTKLAKKPSIFVNKIEEKKDVELIDCLEGQSIKVIGAVEETKGPLVIPIKDNAKNLLDRVKDARKNRETKTTVSNEDTRPDSELTLDELAARQLLQEAQTNAKKSDETKVHTLPLTADNVPLEGEKESTLEDYENIPINDFGLAMLRGMGWKDGAGIGKNPKTVAKADAPELRPKGLGLGATKMVKIDKPPPAVDKEGKELQLVKGAHAKIIAGKYKGFYCEVQGLDEETGRIIVQTKIKQEVLSLNEFLVIPVTKDEFIKNSKVLNNAKYEEYKVKSETQNKEDDKKIKREKIIKEEHMSDNDDVQVIEPDIKLESVSSPEDRKPSRRTPSPKNNRNSKIRQRSNSRSPSRRDKERYRSRSRSPAHKRHKSGKSKNRSRSRSAEYRNERYRKSESSDSEYDRKDKKKKKKSKKSKKERYDSDSDKDRYRKKKSKKESKKYDGSDSGSDKKCKYRDKSKSSKSRR